VASSPVASAAATSSRVSVASVSYEPLGTVGFLLLGAGPGFAGLYFVAVQSRPPEPAWDRVRRLAGIPAPDPERLDLTEDDLGTLPSPSIWPFALALGLTVAATGLVFGFWPLLLGGGVVILAAARWQAAVNREVRWGGCGGRAGRRRTPAAGLSRSGPSGGVGHRRRGQRQPVLDGAGQQQPGAADLGPLAQPPAAVLPAGQALALQAPGRQGGVLAGDRQRGPVLPGTAGAAEPEDAVHDAPDGHAVAAGMRLGFHQDRPVGQDPGVVPFLDRANFRRQSVQAASLNGVEHFLHVASIGQR
jgi:Cytochrome c oxidase subunit IV